MLIVRQNGIRKERGWIQLRSSFSGTGFLMPFFKAQIQESEVIALSLLQDITHTIYYQVEALAADWGGLSLQYGLPASAPADFVAAVDHDKTRLDEQYELAGCRKRPRVFFVDVYAPGLAERNDLCEAIKDAFENKNLPVLNAARQDTGAVMACEGVRVEVDPAQRLKARVKVYVFTLIN